MGRVDTMGDCARRLVQRPGDHTVVTSRAYLDVPPGVAPILAPEELRRIADDVLRWSVADVMIVHVEHRAVGMSRVLQGRVRMQESGDRLQVFLRTQFDQRAEVQLQVDQIDLTSLRTVVRYLDRVAREQIQRTGSRLSKPAETQRYLQNTTWNVGTAAAFNAGRHAAIATLVAPVLDAGFLASAFVGVLTRTVACADKRGIMAVGQETDSELVVTGWTSDGKGAGWAGQAAPQ